MTTNSNLPGVLEERIKTLIERLTRAQEQVDAAEADLANACDYRNDLQSELGRAIRALAARDAAHMGKA
jgi:hypothetical protein